MSPAHSPAKRIAVQGFTGKTYFTCNGLTTAGFHGIIRMPLSGLMSVCGRLTGHAVPEYQNHRDTHPIMSLLKHFSIPNGTRPAIFLLAALLLLTSAPAAGFTSQKSTSGSGTGSSPGSLHTTSGSRQLSLDTLFSEELTPGVVHTRYLVSGPNIMDVVAVDLSAPWLHFETSRPDELARTTELSLAEDRPGNRVVAAVNGDFFSFDTHWPIANQMVRGEFAHGVPVRNRYHFAVDSGGRPFMDALSFHGSLTLSGLTALSVYSINRSVSDADIVAFNRFFGEQTPRGSEILELVLIPQSESAQAGSGVELPMQITGTSEDGNTPIPQNGYVIRIQDPEIAASVASVASPGVLASFRAGFKPDRRHLIDVIGGGVRILDDGSPYSGTNEARHPRTFVAMDRDTTTVLLCTVDGRQLTSIGMSYREMADVLLQLGAWHAVNLDGGGSTTLAIRNEVANSPSDPGGERMVANALMLISTAPEGAAERLEMQPESFSLYPHESQRITINAFDKFQNPVPVPRDIHWEFDPVLGRMKDGFFTPGATDTTGTITVHSGDISATTRARIHHFTSLTADPEALMLAPGEQAMLTLRGRTAGDAGREIPLDRVQFRQPEEALYLSDDGTVHATGYGSGSLHLDVGSASLTIPYEVSGDAVTRVIHDFTGGIDGWATPAQTHRSQIQGVDPDLSSLVYQNGIGIWTFVDNPERDVDWDIRITRHLRQELGSQLYGSYVGAWVKADEELDIRLVIRDGDGQLEAGPATRLVPGQWQLIQTRLSDSRFEGYLNGDGRLTREGNQVNGFRIKASGREQGAVATLEIDRILTSPFPLQDHGRPD